MPKADDGADPEVHIWRVAPSRRDLLGCAGWAAVIGSMGAGSLAFVRMMFPRVLFEPPSQFKLGQPSSYAAGSVSTRWMKTLRLWLVRFDDRFVALSAECTHLGCTVRYLPAEDKFKCPCHGSGFRGSGAGWAELGQHYEGPAPRPLDRFALSLDEDGEIVVSKSVIYRVERGEAGDPGAYLPYA